MGCRLSYHFPSAGDARPADRLCDRPKRRRYPVLTLLGQALGSIVLSAEGLLRFTPETFIDTAVRAAPARGRAPRGRAGSRLTHRLCDPQGYAFSYPLARLAGCKVVAYVHYPMISTDMLGRVRGREVAFNNRAAVARSPLLSGLKVLYYRALASLYGARRLRQQHE